MMKHVYEWWIYHIHNRCGDFRKLWWVHSKLHSLWTPCTIVVGIFMNCGGFIANQFNNNSGDTIAILNCCGDFH